jgi:hypothetical protein
MSRIFILVAALLASSVQARSGDLVLERVTVAQEYFRAVYSGDTAALDPLASPDIVVSYPLFVEVLGTPAIQGLADVKGFSTRFSQRWTSPDFEFHDSVSDGDKVALIWSFSAQSAAPLKSEGGLSAERQAWGGITLFRFDDVGRVVAEIGEESTPGPMGRLRELDQE